MMSTETMDGLVHFLHRALNEGMDYYELLDVVDDVTNQFEELYTDEVVEE